LHAPTRGVDVGAQRETHRVVLAAAAAGAAVIVASSETDELLEICDRIVALSSGRVTATFDRARFDRAALATAVMRTKAEAP
jgi:ribose transport system ATP-binding protein